MARSQHLTDLGTFLVVVASPLFFLPFTASPFSDGKLVLIALAGVAFALRAPMGLRGLLGSGARLSTAGAALLLAGSAFALIAGTARWQGILGHETQGAGFVLIALCAWFVVAAQATPGGLTERAPAWMLLTGSAATVGYVVQAYTDVLPIDYRSGELPGSALGQPVLLAGYLATALAAAAGARGRISAVVLWPGLVICATGLSLSSRRSGLLAVAAGLAVALLASSARVPDGRQSGRSARGRALARTAAVAAVLGLWVVLDVVGLAPVTDEGVPASAASRFGEVAPGLSADQRLATWTAALRAVADRPATGWGPSAAGSAVLSVASGEELARGVRGYGDVHMLPLEVLVALGPTALAGLAVLATAVLARILGSGVTAPWALAGAASLAVHHLVQPLSVSLTPMLFLLAFAAVASRPAGPEDSTGPDPTGAPAERPARPAMIVVIAGMLLAAALARATASGLEWYGDRYLEAGALRAASVLEPYRPSALRKLALIRAVDARAGAVPAAAEVRSVVASARSAHPWRTDVRLWAADAMLLLDDRAAAEQLITEHLSRFPNDHIASAGLAALLATDGRTQEARRLAAASLAVVPTPLSCRVADELEIVVPRACRGWLDQRGARGDHPSPGARNPG